MGLYHRGYQGSQIYNLYTPELSCTTDTTPRPLIIYSIQLAPSSPSRHPFQKAAAYTRLTSLSWRMYPATPQVAYVSVVQQDHNDDDGLPERQQEKAATY